VIDGGSSDGTLDVLNNHKEDIDYYVSEPDSGLYEAMNKGLSLAAGDFIIILNSDDWYEDSAIEQLLNAVVRCDADVAHADACYVDSFGKKLHIEKAWLHDGIYTRGAPLRHETMLVSKNAYEQVGEYDESYKILSDYILMISLYDAGLKFIHVDIPLLFFRTTGISNNAVATKEIERARLFSRIFPFLDSDDLSILKKHGRLDRATRLKMLSKHKGKSELFARSMAFNIADFQVREGDRNIKGNSFTTLNRKILNTIKAIAHQYEKRSW
jgi:glycosyltransferase involved in cell wall biosynthesis